jgi:hypothetical protein
MLNEGNQIHNFMSSSGYGSGSDFLTSYSSGSGSGSKSQKVTVPTVPVPVPVPVPQHWFAVSIQLAAINVHLFIINYCIYLIRSPLPPSPPPYSEVTVAVPEVTS